MFALAHGHEKAEKSEKKAILSGFAFNYVRIIIFIVASLIYPPYLLAHVGKVDNGILSFAVSLLEIFTLLSFGIEHSYIHFAINREKERGDAGLKRLNGSYFILFSIIGVVILALGIGVAFIYKEGILSVAETGPEKADLIFALIVIMSVSTAYEFFMSFFAYYTLFRSHFVHHQVVLISMKILTVVTAMLSLHFGQGVLAVAIAMLCVSILDGLINVVYSLGELKMRITFGDSWNIKRDLHEILRFSFYIFLTMIVTQIENNTGKLILSYRIGGSAVTVFEYGVEFYLYAAMLSKGIGETVGPRINALIAEKDTKETANVFLKSSFILMSILFFVFGGYALLGRSFINLWLGNSDLTSGELDAVYIIGLCSLAVWLLPLSQSAAVEIRRATHKHRFLGVTYLITALLSLAVSISLTWALPDDYAVYGPLIGICLFAFFGPFFAAQFYYGAELSMPLGRFYIDFLLFALITGLSFALPYCLALFFFEPLSSLASGIFQLSLFVLTFILLYLLLFKKRLSDLRAEAKETR